MQLYLRVELPMITSKENPKVYLWNFLRRTSVSIQNKNPTFWRIPSSLAPYNLSLTGLCLETFRFSSCMPTQFIHHLRRRSWKLYLFCFSLYELGHQSTRTSFVNAEFRCACYSAVRNYCICWTTSEGISPSVGTILLIPAPHVGTFTWWTYFPLIHLNKQRTMDLKYLRPFGFGWANPECHSMCVCTQNASVI